MGRGEKKISSGPLFARIGGTRGGARRFADGLNVSEQVVSNWKRRGVPAAELPRVADALGISVELYLREAGQPVGRAEQPGAQYTLETAQLLDDFSALPDGLKEFVARKTRELRRYADGLPAFLREAIKAPPADPERYRTWEREIEADMYRRRAEDDPPPRSNPSGEAAPLPRRLPLPKPTEHREAPPAKGTRKTSR